MGGTTGADGGINTQAVLSMVGSGYYSERTAGARDVINNAAQMVLAALAETPDTPAIRFADFGAADGGTSQQLWDRVVKPIVTTVTAVRSKFSIQTLQAMTFLPSSA